MTIYLAPTRLIAFGILRMRVYIHANSSASDSIWLRFASYCQLVSPLLIFWTLYSINYTAKRMGFLSPLVYLFSCALCFGARSSKPRPLKARPLAPALVEEDRKRVLSSGLTFNMKVRVCYFCLIVRMIIMRCVHVISLSVE